MSTDHAPEKATARLRAGRVRWRAGLVGAGVLAAGALVVTLAGEPFEDGYATADRIVLHVGEVWFVVVAAVLGGILGAEPWRAFVAPRPGEEPWQGPRPLDRARVDLAVGWYDFWLEFYDVPRGARRTARNELRANLVAAAEDTSAAEAVSSVGGLRRLARDNAAELTLRRRWHWPAGLVAAAVVAATLVVLFSGAVAGYSDGITDVTGRAPDSFGMTFGTGVEVEGDIDGRITLWGAPVALDRAPDGAISRIDAQLPVGWALLPALGFVLVSRPWRAFARR